MRIFEFLFLRRSGIFTGLLFAFSCSMRGPLRDDPKAAHFKLGKLPKVWSPETSSKKSISADAVFVHSETGAYLSFNSLCRRYPDSSLLTLTQQLLSPISAYSIEDQKKIIVDAREALLTSVKGRLDGVPIEATFVVLRKNECIFDFSIFSRNEIIASDKSDFEKFYGQFQYAGGVKD